MQRWRTSLAQDLPKTCPRLAQDLPKPSRRIAPNKAPSVEDPKELLRLISGGSDNIGSEKPSVIRFVAQSVTKGYLHKSRISRCWRIISYWFCVGSLEHRLVWPSAAAEDRKYFLCPSSIAPSDFYNCLENSDGAHNAFLIHWTFFSSDGSPVQVLYSQTSTNELRYIWTTQV